jgi:diguanylate cyclase (GGDEF)-like protein/PAS domain S-box-containing protein
VTPKTFQPSVGSHFDGMTVRHIIISAAPFWLLEVERDGRPLLVSLLASTSALKCDLDHFSKVRDIAVEQLAELRLQDLATGSVDGMPYLVVDSFGAFPLLEKHDGGSFCPVTLGVSDWLSAALEIQSCLESIHQAGWLHRNLSPASVLMPPKSNKSVLWGLHLACRVSTEGTGQPLDFNGLEGTVDVDYMAPECSGRTAIKPDYRSDFYSLGATLFALLTGHPPFEGTSSAELIYAHLTQSVPDLRQWVPELPLLAIGVVERLLAKDPADRYQSHAALRRDLSHLLQYLHDPVQRDSLILAAGDVSELFSIPDTLYGRHEVLASVEQAFRAVAAGGSVTVMLGGPSGSGKSAIYDALVRTMHAGNGRFCLGKFGQSGQVQPCYGFFDALKKPLREMLRKEPADKLTWSQKLAFAIAPNAALLISVLPELGELLGPVSAVADLGPAETENRLLYTLQQLITVLAEEANPLVLFIDDLQWSDQTSRRLFRNIALSNTCGKLLLIGTWRNDEIDKNHPFQDVLNDLSTNGETIIWQSLSTLGRSEVNAMLADVLHIPPTEPALISLTAICLQKTGGNPLFLRRFLTHLYQLGLLYFDRKAGRWTWSEYDIAGQQADETLVSLMLRQLQLLPSECRAMLAESACLGAEFDLMRLAYLKELEPEVIRSTLAPALDNLLIVPLKQDEKDVFRFAHDRIQEAASLLLDENAVTRLNVRIGRKLLEENSAGRGNAWLEILGHFNRGRALITTDVERSWLAERNETIASEALNSGGFDVAADLYAIALELRGGDYWNESTATACNLSVSAARALSLSGRRSAMQTIVEAALPRCSDALQKARLLDVQVESFYATGELGQTLDIGLEALQVLGLTPPDISTPAELIVLVAQLADHIRDIGISHLESAPVLDDPVTLCQLTIIARMTAAAYIARPALLPLLTILQVRQMMAFGHAPIAMSAWSVLGLLVAELLGDYPFGYKLGRMSVDMLHRHGWTTVYAHAGFSFNAFLHHWMKPAKEGLPSLLDVFDNGVACGNFRHAGLALYVQAYHRILCGESLGELDSLFDVQLRELKQIRQPVAQDYLTVAQAAIFSLRAGDNDASQAPGISVDSLSVDALSVDTMRTRYEARSDQTGLFFLDAFECIKAGLLLKPQDSLQAGERALARGAAARGMYMMPFCLWFTAVSACQLKTGTHQALIDEASLKLARWGEHNRDILLLSQLLETWRTFASGQSVDLDAQLESLAGARPDMPNPLLEGLLCLSRAQLLEAMGKASAVPFRDARLAFMTWGADAVVECLDASSMGLRLQEERDIAPRSGSNTGDIDLHSLMKSVQLITGEIRLERLLATLLNVLSENAGATRAMIILRQEDQWLLRADTQKPDLLINGNAILLDSARDQVPVDLVKTIIRDGRSLVLADLSPDSAWGRLPYYRERGLRSSLSVPLIRGGDLLGVVLLENDKLNGAFPPARIGFIELLAGNIVNAIDNARLYEKMERLTGQLEKRVQSRTRELKDSENRLLSILKNMPVPVSVTRHRDAHLLYVNSLACNMMHASEEDLIGYPAPSFYYDRPEREALFARYRKEGVVHNQEVRLKALKGDVRWVVMSIVPITFDDEPAELSSMLDITDRKTMEENLRISANTDAMTGLGNRRWLMTNGSNEITRANRYKRPLAVVMFDIDYFKQINDRFGHGAGDTAIISVCEACVATMRQNDLIARLGGEEFIILLPETTLSEAVMLAERLREKIKTLRLPELDTGRFTFTASFGVSCVVKGDDLESMLARVDRLLYKAKNDGRDRVECASPNEQLT